MRFSPKYFEKSHINSSGGSGSLNNHKLLLASFGIHFFECERECECVTFQELYACFPYYVSVVENTVI